jgi:hypothetical protein
MTQAQHAIDSAIFTTLNSPVIDLFDDYSIEVLDKVDIMRRVTEHSCSVYRTVEVLNEMRRVSDSQWWLEEQITQDTCVDAPENGFCFDESWVLCTIFEDLCTGKRTPAAEHAFMFPRLECLQEGATQFRTDVLVLLTGLFAMAMRKYKNKYCRTPSGELIIYLTDKGFHLNLNGTQECWWSNVFPETVPCFGPITTFETAQLAEHLLRCTAAVWWQVFPNCKVVFEIHPHLFNEVMCNLPEFSPHSGEGDIEGPLTKAGQLIYPDWCVDSGLSFHIHRESKRNLFCTTANLTTFTFSTNKRLFQRVVVPNWRYVPLPRASTKLAVERRVATAAGARWSGLTWDGLTASAVKQLSLHHCPGGADRVESGSDVAVAVDLATLEKRQAFVENVNKIACAARSPEYMTAFAMCLHERLGENSAASCLTGELLALISGHVDVIIE